MVKTSCTRVARAPKTAGVVSELRNVAISYPLRRTTEHAHNPDDEAKEYPS
ncbi:BolA family transcriptional regulator [Acetobacter orientalis]|uniref:BolA family transcriptional regulator n=1 Tax=Acetobacter orientalis TaxID=146474 RepID=A0A2Z5ZE08_9PROT|nr:BolA family transcriptional regulator [Acetobacter orientalis]